jgi:pimeloyl-ACP methyl ester carboxylesterase
MTALLADEVLRLADGRLLAWTEWGDPRGSPLVFLHPCPGSRMFCPDEQTTTAQGIRLIAVDRPGYGGSDPVADPTLTGFATDLERLADHLWLGQFPLVGWSGGGSYAAACAARLGERVSGLVLVATPARRDEAPWLSPAAADLRRLAIDDPQRALAAVAARRAELAADPDRAGERWASPSDTAVRRRPGVEHALRVMWEEGLRAGLHGLAADVVAGLRPWDFAPTQVLTPAVLFYGDDDPVVSLPEARWWEQALPDAHLRVMQGGHLLPVMAWAEILNAIQR